MSILASLGRSATIRRAGRVKMATKRRRGGIAFIDVRIATKKHKRHEGEFGSSAQPFVIFVPLRGDSLRIGALASVDDDEREVGDEVERDHDDLVEAQEKIERKVDRVSRERHPLALHLKDAISGKTDHQG